MPGANDLPPPGADDLGPAPGMGPGSVLRYLTQPRDIRSSALIMMMMKLGSFVVGIASSVLIARALGPADKGIYNLVLLVATLSATVATLGINNGSFFFLARGRLSLPTAYGNAVLVVTAFTSLMVVCLLVFSNGTEAGVGVAVLVVLFPLTLHSFMAQPLLIGVNRAVMNYALPLLSQVVTVLASVAVLLSGGGLRGFLWAYVGASLITQVATVLVLRTHARHLLGRPELPQLWAAFRFGWPLWTAFLLSTALQRIDQLVVVTQLGDASLGQYALAVAIGELLWSIDLPVVSALRYRVTSGSGEDAAALVGRAARLVVIALGAACLFAAVTAPWLVPVVYSQAYAPAVPALLAYLPAVFFLGVGRIVGEDIGYQRQRTGLVLVNNAIAVACNLALLALLLPPLGIVGAALASSGAYFVLLVLNTFWHTRLAHVPVRSVLVPSRTEFELLRDLIASLPRRARRLGQRRSQGGGRVR